MSVERLMSRLLMLEELVSMMRLSVRGVLEISRLTLMGGSLTMLRLPVLTIPGMDL